MQTVLTIGHAQNHASRPSRQNLDRRHLRSDMCLWGIAFLSLVLPAPALASNWVKVYTTKTGTVIYMDASNLRKEGNHPTAWFRSDRSLDRTAKEHETKILDAFDCQGQRMAVISGVSYAINGAVLNSVTVPYDQLYWTPVVPDSAGEAQLTMVCAYASAANN